MNTIKYNSTGHDVDVLQTMLDIPHNPAHEFNKTTYQAVIDFQKRNGLEADGIVGYKTWEALFFHGERPKYGITESDFDRAAMLLDCEPAALKAVQKVETGGKGGFPAQRSPHHTFRGAYLLAAASRSRHRPTRSRHRQERGHPLSQVDEGPL